MRHSIKQETVIKYAKGLLEPGEEHLNPQYTRALIELCCDCCGFSQDDKPRMARKLGIPEDKIELVV